MKEITTLYFVRHGATNLNKKMCMQGITDEPLSDLGHEQGKCLIQYFENIPIDICVTSPLIRAKQTLDYVLKSKEKNKIPIIVDPRFREIEGGDFEGIPFTEIEKQNPGFLKIIKDSPGTCQFPNGENGTDVYNRVVEGTLDIVRQNKGKTIVVTGHGFAIQTWINYVNNIPPNKMCQNNPENVSVSKFLFDEKMNIAIEYINDYSHLSPKLRQNYNWDALFERGV